MKFTQPLPDPLADTLAPVLKGLGLSLVDLSLSRQKGSVQVRLTVYKAGITGIEDCSKAHHAVLPRLELAFPGEDIYVEVSSPGIDRLIKDGAEFVHFIGRGIKCFRTDISDWTAGILKAADSGRVIIEEKSGEVSLDYNVIAKAKLDFSQEV
jgi:ribosome maturation factor RimP